jgi:hypothetical protein
MNVIFDLKKIGWRYIKKGGKEVLKKRNDERRWNKNTQKNTIHSFISLFHFTNSQKDRHPAAKKKLTLMTNRLLLVDMLLMMMLMMLMIINDFIITFQKRRDWRWESKMNVDGYE